MNDFRFPKDALLSKFCMKNFLTNYLQYAAAKLYQYSHKNASSSKLLLYHNNLMIGDSYYNLEINVVVGSLA